MWQNQIRLYVSIKTKQEINLLHLKKIILWSIILVIPEEQMRINGRNLGAFIDPAHVYGRWSWVPLWVRPELGPLYQHRMMGKKT
jgi:hypothetical protein